MKMKIYEVRIYLKKYNVTKIIDSTSVLIDGDKIEIADYSTGMTLFYNKDDVIIEYIKENSNERR